MTNFKRFSAAVAATLMAACMAAPMAMNTSAAGETPSYSITIQNTTAGHTYKAYQIFTGDLANGVLSNIVWGDGITEAGQTALGNAATLAETLEDEDDAISLANNIKGYLGTVAATDDSVEGGYVLSVSEPGYYIIVDETNTTVNGTHDAYSSYILKVLGSVSMEPKSALPTVDKQVLDDDDAAESGDNNGWGETADHAINDNVQFKLIATIDPDADYAYYETYKLVFNDKMSSGITFDSIESVTVTGYSGTVAYDLSEINTETNSFTVTIDNLLDYDNDLTNGATVEVIYNAHLNSNAYVNTTSGATENENTVFLQYSNNPNWDSTGGTDEDLGETPEDTVWVYTYKIENTKVNGSQNNAALQGAGFRLYDSTGNTEVPVIWDETLSAYRIAKNGETAVEMISGNDGSFDIAGLDVGTYILKETTVPAGFNKCKDTTIKISATHTEDSSKTSSTATLSSDSTMENQIINNEGTTLPGTGGIGTTLFYLGGGAMVAVAGIYLISKKRMKNTDEE